MQILHNYFGQNFVCYVTNYFESTSTATNIKKETFASSYADFHD